MVYRIRQSTLAKTTFFDNIKYLEDNWSERVVISFLKKVAEITKLIKHNPELFPKWNENITLRKVSILPQITMFYKINKTTIDILLFWNNYQNPNNLIELLNK